MGFGLFCGFLSSPSPWHPCSVVCFFSEGRDRGGGGGDAEGGREGEERAVVVTMPTEGRGGCCS